MDYNSPAGLLVSLYDSNNNFICGTNENWAIVQTSTYGG
jgi:hypothetical protein